MVVLAILGLSGPALAGGPIAVAEDPAPMAPAPAAETHDWSGPYVGLSYGRTSGDVYFSTDQFLDLENGSIGGFHAGYLWQRGNLVQGAELAYGSVSGSSMVYAPAAGIVSAIDLKERIGFAANRTLFYGVLGYSKARFTEPPVDQEFDMTGMAYVFGAENALNKRLVIGLEQLARDVSSPLPGIFPIDVDTNFDSISLRLSLSV